MNISQQHMIIKRQMSISKRQRSIADIILCCMLVLPFASHWVLPDGMERQFYLNLLGVPFYVPNLCYFFYITSYRQLKSKSSDYVRKSIISTMIKFTSILFVYSVFSSAMSDANATIALIFNNQSLVWASIVFLFFPMSMSMIENTKYVIIPTAIIISLEIILFGLGLVTYKVDLGTNEYEGIIRISTTVGAATGTAVSLVMMGCVITDCYKIQNRLKIALLLLISVAILFTVSRGSIAIWGAYVVLYLYREYYRNSKIGTKVKYLLLFTITFFLGFSVGVFNPVIERTETLRVEGEMDSGRGYLEARAMKVFRESGGMGVGNGTTHVDKSLRYIANQRGHIGVHSYYLSTLAEMGIIGIVLIILYFSFLVRKFDYSRNISYGALILLLLSFSTEPIFTQAEFMSPAVFLFMISLKRFKRHEGIVCK